MEFLETSPGEETLKGKNKLSCACVVVRVRLYVDVWMFVCRDDFPVQHIIDGSGLSVKVRYLLIVDDWKRCFME